MKKLDSISFSPTSHGQTTERLNVWRQILLWQPTDDLLQQSVLKSMPSRSAQSKVNSQQEFLQAGYLSHCHNTATQVPVAYC